MTKANDTVYNTKSAKLLYGVAYNSKGRYKAFSNGKKTKAYITWWHMIRRCYNPEVQVKNPTYIGCSVASEWHDFQDFAEWYYSQKDHSMGYELDKDVLVRGNKVYSPNNCTLLPQPLNALLNDHRAARGKYPQGVCFHKSSGKIMGTFTTNGKTKYLGLFDCPNKAHKAYKLAKEAYVKEKALEWQDHISPDVFQALMNWQLTD